MSKTRIKTVIISPTRLMPKEVFLVCHRLAFFVEHMDRTGPNEVIWDEACEALYGDDAAEAEYIAHKRKWIEASFEIPEAFAASIGVPHAQMELLA